jgi:hypothetical protein
MTSTPVIGRCAAHHPHLLTVATCQMVADTVFCGGRWPAALLAEMEAASD